MSSTRRRPVTEGDHDWATTSSARDDAFLRGDDVPPPGARIGRRPQWVAAGVYAIVAANVGVIIWLWVHGGNPSPTSTGDALTAVGRLTGLLAAFLALIQVVLLARLPALERAVGFDRLSVWHRWNGHACIDLVVAHVVFTVWGYSLMDRFTLGHEISTMLGGGIYPGMITATVGTGMLLGVVADLGRHRAAPAALRVLVRRPSAAYAGDRALLVPRDPDRGRAGPDPARRRLLARRSSSQRSRPLAFRLLVPLANLLASACASPR